jgi:hypothetical protein
MRDLDGLSLTQAAAPAVAAPGATDVSGPTTKPGTPDKIDAFVTRVMDKLPRHPAPRVGVSELLQRAAHIGLAAEPEPHVGRNATRAALRERAVLEDDRVVGARRE